MRNPATCCDQSQQASAIADLWRPALQQKRTLDLERMSSSAASTVGHWRRIDGGCPIFLGYAGVKACTRFFRAFQGFGVEGVSPDLRVVAIHADIEKRQGKKNKHVL